MDNSLQRKIMRRVYTLYVLRRATSARAVKLYMMLISTAAVLSLVSVSHVLQNMPSILDVRATLVFMISAFAHTGAAVQLFVAVFLGAVVTLGFEFTRASHYARARV